MRQWKRLREKGGSHHISCGGYSYIYLLLSSRKNIEWSVMKYPTRNHMPISTRELDLPRSELDPEKHGSTQNHHLFYYSPAYKADVVYNSLRDLDMHQERLARDQHILGKLAVHNVFTDGVPLPPMKTAMERLEVAFETGERFKVWDIQERRYVYHKFTREHWDRLQAAYITCYTKS